MGRFLFQILSLAFFLSTSQAEMSPIAFRVAYLKSVQSGYFCDNGSRFFGFGVPTNGKTPMIFNFELLDSMMTNPPNIPPPGVAELGEPSSLVSPQIYGTYLDLNHKLWKYSYNLRTNIFSAVQIPESLKFSTKKPLPQVSQDGRLISGISDSGKLIVWDIDREKVISPQFKTGFKSIQTSLMNPEGTLIVGSYLDNHSRTHYFSYSYGFPRQNNLKELEISQFLIGNTVSSKDGRYILSDGYSNLTHRQDLLRYDAEFNRLRDYSHPEKDYQVKSLSNSGRFSAGVLALENQKPSFCWSVDGKAACNSEMFLDGVTGFNKNQVITYLSTGGMTGLNVVQIHDGSTIPTEKF